jgi:hypothetical protein
MRFIALLAVLLAVAPAWAAKPAAEFDITVSGRIEIGPDGRVRDYSVDKATPQAVRGLVDKAVRAWEFEPIVEGGRAVTATTGLKMKLVAQPEGDDYLLRIAHVWFGTATPHKMTPPRWPNVPVAGQVVLVLHVDEQGRVDRLHVERTDLGSLGTRPQMEQWRRRFEAAALAAAKSWEFGPIEVVDGKPVATDVRVPVAFTSGATWDRWYRGDSKPAPWRATSTASATASAEGEGSLGSRFRLRSDVVGKTL